MKTPRNAMSALFREGLAKFDPNPLWSAGLLGCTYDKSFLYQRRPKHVHAQSEACRSVLECRLSPFLI